MIPAADGNLGEREVALPISEETLIAQTPEVGSVRLQQLISAPASRFYSDMQRLLGFCGLVADNCTILDSAARKLVAPLILTVPKETFEEHGASEIYQGAKDFMDGKIGGAAEGLVAYFPLIFEMLFCRSVDNFLNYISEVLALIFTTHPDALKSDEKISIEEVLQYTDRADLLGALTERRVFKATFQGLLALNADLAKTLKFPLFEDADSLKKAATLVEQRNLATHNRRVVNRRYLERVGDTKEKIGDLIQFEPSNILDTLRFLIASVYVIDGRAETKFGIPRDVTSPVPLDPLSYKHDTSRS